MEFLEYRADAFFVDANLNSLSSVSYRISLSGIVDSLRLLSLDDVPNDRANNRPAISLPLIVIAWKNPTPRKGITINNNFLVSISLLFNSISFFLNRYIFLLSIVEFRYTC